MDTSAKEAASRTGARVLGSELSTLSSHARDKVVDSTCTMTTNDAGKTRAIHDAFEAPLASTCDQDEIARRKRMPALQRRRRSLSDCGPLFAMDAPLATAHEKYNHAVTTLPQPEPALPDPSPELAEDNQLLRPSTREWAYQPMKGWNNGDVEYYNYYVDGRRSLTTKAPRHDRDVPRAPPPRRITKKSTPHVRFSQHHHHHHQSFVDASNNTHAVSKEEETCRSNDYSRCIDHGTSDNHTRSQILAMLLSDDKTLYRINHYHQLSDMKPKLRQRLQGGRSILETDFPLFGSFNLNKALFVLYGFLVFLLTMKMASTGSTPHRLAKAQAV
jgi:hypothetical protein